MVEENKPQSIEKVVEKPSKYTKGEKFMRFASVAIVIILSISFIVINQIRPEFNLYIAFGILGGILAFVFIGYLVMKLFGKKKNDGNKLGPIITLEQAREYARKATEDPEYSEYTRASLGEQIHHVGKDIKSVIYQRDSMGEMTRDKYTVLINMHDPKNKMAILINKKKSEINHAIQTLADNPEAEPDLVETIADNLLTGNRITTKKILQQKAEAERAEKKEVEL